MNDHRPIVQYRERSQLAPRVSLHQYLPPAKSLRKFCIVFFSFLVAMLLSILPLPEWAKWCWPLWSCLVLVFWQVALPQNIGLFTAWCSGLVLDVLFDTALGEHAIALLFVAAIVRCLHYKMKMINLAEQMLMLFPVFLLYQALILLMQGMLGQMNHARFFYLPAITTVLLWPWIVFLLMDTARGLARDV